MNLSLLQRISAGDASAVRGVLELHGRLVWRLALNFSRNRADAEDAVQEIFLELWRAAPKFDPTIASESAFVAMVARRRLIDRVRKRQRVRSAEVLDPNIESVEGTSGLDAETCAEAALAARAVSKLRPEQRQVLLLATCQGLSHEEIAGTTGLPLGTVKTHIRRALFLVRDALLGRSQGVPQ